MYLVHDVARCPFGQQYSVPEPDLVAGYPLLLQGRYIGKLRRSRLIGDRQQSELSVFDEMRDERQGDCQNLRMSRDRRVNRRRTALVWNVDDIEPECTLE